MIALIVCGLCFVLSIVVAILFFHYDMDELEFIPVSVFLISIMIFITSILIGYRNRTIDILDRDDLIRNYLNCKCVKHLEKIEEWNSDVNYGNNKWCRFSIEDRSEYLINIDDLLKGE